MRADFKLFDECASPVPGLGRTEPRPVGTSHRCLWHRYKFRHAGAPKFDFPLHCWWCEGEHFIKPEMVQAAAGSARHR